GVGTFNYLRIGAVLDRLTEDRQGGRARGLEVLEGFLADLEVVVAELANEEAELGPVRFRDRAFLDEGQQRRTVGRDLGSLQTALGFLSFFVLGLGCPCWHTPNKERQSPAPDGGKKETGSTGRRGRVGNE